jgi:hypothetical protein
MIVVADPRYKREIYHCHGRACRACMSSPIPNGTWWSCAAFTCLAACGCPCALWALAKANQGIAPYVAADVRGGPLRLLGRAS